MMARDLNALAARVHAAHEKWWIDLDTGERIQRNKFEMLMLMQSEVAEAMEGERKGLMDDKLPHRPMAEVEIADVFIRALDYAGGHGYHLSECVDDLLGSAPFCAFDQSSNRGEVLFQINRLIGEAGACEARGHTALAAYELSRVIAACWVYCALYGYRLMDAFEEKMAFNAVRADHQPEARKAVGGKKW